MSKIEELQADLVDLKALLEKATRQRSKDALFIEIRKLETELTARHEKDQKKLVADTAENSLWPSTNQRPQGCYEVKVTNYGWDQSDKFVKLYIDLPNVHKLAQENVSCQFTSKSVNFSIAALDNKNYTLTITNLLNPIIPEESYTRTKTDKVVVFMKKQITKKWEHISSIEKKAKETRTPKMEEGADPSSSLMDLMKQMYEDGDDEMKRTIAKAWTQSRDASSAGDQ